MLALQELVACVLSLRPRFLVALKRAQNEAQGRGMDDGLAAAEAAAAYDDDDTIKCVVRLFLNASEAFSALIAMGNDQVRRGASLNAVARLGSLLQCAAAPSVFEVRRTY